MLEWKIRIKNERQNINHGELLTILKQLQEVADGQDARIKELEEKTKWKES